MNQLKSLVFVSSLSGAVLFSTPAAAISGFSGTVSGTVYSLMDLDPTDGIAPSIVFDFAAPTLWASSALKGAVAQSDVKQTTGAGETKTTATLSSQVFANSAVALTGDSFGAYTLSAAGSADWFANRGPNGPNLTWAYSEAASNISIGYTLSARTTVRFISRFSFTISTNDQYDSFQHNAAMGAWSYGSGDNDERSGDSIKVIVWKDQSVNQGYVGAYGINRTGTSQSGFFSAGVYGQGFEFIQTQPVPEPETWALMLAGLLGVGFAARRRTT